MKVIVFVRHGKSQTNEEHILSDDLGVHPLTEEGIEQAKYTAEEIAKIPKIDSLYTSPVLRALQTAEIIGKRIGIKPEIDTRLAERSMGSLNNKRFSSAEELLASFKKEIESKYAGGLETFDNLGYRMEDFASSTRGRMAIAVSHSDPIMSILGIFDKKYDDNDWQTKIPYASMTAIDIEGKEIICIGSASLPKSLEAHA